MYRRYEDPYKLERALENAKLALDEARARGDLEQRLAAAWEDDAAEVYGYE